MSSQSESQILFRRQEIETTVRRLATEVERDYRDKYPLLIGILKGSFIFMADLIRQLDFPLEVEFIQVSSYGRNRKNRGKTKIIKELRSSIKGREVLLVEDIIDTGLTTGFVYDYLYGKQPASLRICALTDKPSKRQVSVTVDYLGFTAPDRFLIGYGLDCDEKFRNLIDIHVLEDD